MVIHTTYLEKDIEDILEDYCEDYLDCILVARQFRTPVGVVDLIVKSKSCSNCYYVVEVKRDVLDASAYVQVERYTKYLNSEMSKDGKRVFVSLLIGAYLGEELKYLCDYFHTSDFEIKHPLRNTYYTLFRFSPLSGFRCYERDESEFLYINSRTKNYCHLNAMIKKRDERIEELGNPIENNPFDGDDNI